MKSQVVVPRKTIHAPEIRSFSGRVCSEYPERVALDGVDFMLQEQQACTPPRFFAVAGLTRFAKSGHEFVPCCKELPTVDSLPICLRSFERRRWMAR